MMFTSKKNQKGFIQLPLLIAIIVGVIAVGGVGYVIVKQQQYSRVEKERQDLITSQQNELENAQKEISELKKEDQASSIKQEVKNTSKTRLKSQLDFFDSTFEDLLVDAYINCSVLANYNNVVRYGGTDIKTAFPDSPEIYKNNCRSKYVSMNLVEGKLIAEPELVNVRKKISEFIQNAKGLGMYALDGGDQAAVIDGYEKNLKRLLTEVREEILTARRANGL